MAGVEYAIGMAETGERCRARVSPSAVPGGVADLEQRDRRFGSGTGVGVSAGAAAALLTRHNGFTPGDLFGAADRAQYDAKRRNLTHTAISTELPCPPRARSSEPSDANAR